MAWKDPASGTPKPGEHPVGVKSLKCEPRFTLFELSRPLGPRPYEQPYDVLVWKLQLG